MKIQDLLMRYRKPLFNAEGGAGGGGAPAGGDAGGAPAGDAGAGGEGAAPAGDAATALGGDAPATPEGEGGADGEKPAAGEGENKEGEKGEGEGDAPAPLELSAPEGMENFQGEFDSYASDATSWMQENPQATASEALKWAADRQAAAVSEQATELAASFSKQVDQWGKDAQADAEIGGDKYAENVAVASKAIEAFGSPELRNLLNESGLGNHPEMIRFAFKAGASLSESSIVKPTGEAAARSFADSLYPKK